MDAIIEKVKDRAGGIVALARSLGIKHNSIYSWEKIPAERVIDVERLTGISRHELRPDVFGFPSKPSKRAEARENTV